MSLILSGTDGLSDVDGTAATPAIRGTDANTGIFFPAADTIAFSEGGAEAMRINSSGNVGIGTVSPSTKLTVYDATSPQVTFDNGTSTFIVGNSAGGNNKILYGTGAHPMIFYTNAIEAARIDSSGRLGIGTATPDTTTLMTVAGAVTITGNNTGHGASRLKLGQDTSAISQIRFYGVDAATAGILQFTGSSSDASVGGERMRIDSSGNVGIGISSFSARFNANLDNATAYANTAPNAANCTAAFTNGSAHTSGGTFVGYQLNISGNSQNRIGYIGAISGSASDQSLSLVFGTNTGAGDRSEKMRLDSSGSLQLKKASNETEATAQFYISGSGYEAYHWLDSTAYYIGQNSSVRSLRIYSNSYTAGVNLASGGTSWGTFSDERLKYDIEPITNGLDKLNSIRCVSYRLKDVDASDSQKKLGIIAQDLVGVVDEVIDITKRHGDETDYMSVRYTELIPVLIKSIQEQQALITQLTARITALEGA